MPDPSPLAALEAFIDDPRLADLEAQGGEFNVFGALRLVHRERTHSDMLAWLCDPAGTHGLGDAFLVRLVRHLARSSGGAGGTPTLFDVDGWDLSDAEVRREWRGVDLLVLDDRAGFALVLENKVWSSEHSDQLARYRRVAERELAGHRRRFFVYLTPAGDEPSHPDYVPLGYPEVAGLLGDLLDSRRTNANAEVLSFIDQYRRATVDNLTDDSEVAEICRQIYRTHRRAIDLVLSHVPDSQTDVRDALVALVEADPDLLPDDSSLSLIRFAPAALDGLLRTGEGWTSSGRLLLFEFYNPKGDDLRLNLYLGPGDDDDRRRIYGRAREHRGLFPSAKPEAPSPKYQRLFQRPVVSRDDLAGLPPEELEAALRDVLDEVKRTYVVPTVAALGGLQEGGQLAS